MKLKSGLVIKAIPNWAHLKNEQKAFVEMWIEALKSSKYKQGKEVLKSLDERFCCLGIAADLEANIGDGIWTIEEVRIICNPETAKVNLFSHKTPTEERFTANSDSFLPIWMQEKYGIGTSGLYVTVDKQTWPVVVNSKAELTKLGTYDASLVDLNDGGNATFVEIAGVLEKALKGGYFIPNLSNTETGRIDKDLCRINRTPSIINPSVQLPASPSV